MFSKLTTRRLLRVKSPKKIFSRCIKLGYLKNNSRLFHTLSNKYNKNLYQLNSLSKYTSPYSIHYLNKNFFCGTTKTTKDTTENENNSDDTPNDENSDDNSRVFVGGPRTLVEREMFVESMTPKRIVEELDRFIIGQSKAKKAVAVSLRNRWRRQQLEDDLRREVLPMNILMIGPTGSGKTEIARRLAQRVEAPFVKVEATKYTEVGIVGQSAEECIKDLVDKSVKMERQKRTEKLKDEIDAQVEKHILARIPGSASNLDEYRQKLRDGEFDNTKIEVASFRLEPQYPGFSIPGLSGIPGIRIGGIKQPKTNVTDHDKQRDRVPISEAREIIREYELQRSIDEDDIRRTGIKRAEESGIIFLDEIDKLCGGDMRGDYKGVKGEGVQKELLGLIEGTTVSTDFGTIHTDHILFIASGAFHQNKPSDLLPELQGRLPIRVELDALTEEDFLNILTITENNLIKQQTALFGSEGVDLVFNEGAIKTIAKFSKQLNEDLENIGARRLRAVISKIVEDLSFEAPEKRGETVSIDGDYVEKQLKDIVVDRDLSNYIL